MPAFLGNPQSFARERAEELWHDDAVYDFASHVTLVDRHALVIRFTLFSPAVAI
jgi:hypothetical protein